MILNPQAPIRSFLSGCLFLAALVTGALMAWTLRQESGQKYCAPDGWQVYGICQPTADFLLNGVVWYVLIFGALAMPVVSIAAMRWMARRRGGPQG